MQRHAEWCFWTPEWSLQILAEPHSTRFWTPGATNRQEYWYGQAKRRSVRIVWGLQTTCVLSGMFWLYLTMFVLRCGRFVVLTYFDSYDFTSKTHRSTQIWSSPEHSKGCTLCTRVEWVHTFYLFCILAYWNLETLGFPTWGKSAWNAWFLAGGALFDFNRWCSLPLSQERHPKNSTTSSHISLPLPIAGLGTHFFTFLHLLHLLHLRGSRNTRNTTRRSGPRDLGTSGPRRVGLSISVVRVVRVRDAQPVFLRGVELWRRHVVRLESRRLSLLFRLKLEVLVARAACL